MLFPPTLSLQLTEASRLKLCPSGTPGAIPTRLGVQTSAPIQAAFLKRAETVMHRLGFNALMHVSHWTPGEVSRPRASFTVSIEDNGEIHCQGGSLEEGHLRLRVQANSPEVSSNPVTAEMSVLTRISAAQTLPEHWIVKGEAERYLRRNDLLMVPLEETLSILGRWTGQQVMRQYYRQQQNHLVNFETVVQARTLGQEAAPL